jgi:hypothetical protein
MRFHTVRPLLECFGYLLSVRPLSQRRFSYGKKFLYLKQRNGFALNVVLKSDMKIMFAHNVVQIEMKVK